MKYIFNLSSPLYLQVIEDIKRKIAVSIMKAGEKLPSSRELALEYGINPNTASRVYKEMEMEDLCYTKRGIGTFITKDEIMINTIKKSMANSYVKNYITSMQSLGYTKKDIVAQIENEEID